MVNVRSEKLRGYYEMTLFKLTFALFSIFPSPSPFALAKQANYGKNRKSLR